MSELLEQVRVHRFRTPTGGLRIRPRRRPWKDCGFASEAAQFRPALPRKMAPGRDTYFDANPLFALRRAPAYSFAPGKDSQLRPGL
jgi:hypothetical protein